MIEAMACGTPTSAFNCGSVPEVITHGVSGLIVNNMLEAVSAVAEASTLNRAACRQEFETRFTASRMAQDYVKLYEAMLSTSLFPGKRDRSIRFSLGRFRFDGYCPGRR
jgi:glycosyltransferase involved in cell wall biosynthesis